MGRASAVSAATTVFPISAFASKAAGIKDLPFQPLAPTSQDDLVLAAGFRYQMLLKRGDVINAAGDTFGDECDYIAYLPDEGNPNEGTLWVNQEAYSPMLVSGFTGGARTPRQWEQEMKSVGGSIVRVRLRNGQWEPVMDARNKRLDGFTEIPFLGPGPIAGATSAIGTMGNCAGGVTPWGTVLTCEENTNDYYGSVHFDEVGNRHANPEAGFYGWYQFKQRPPEHYGWVVEVDTQRGTARKLTSLGRFAHECATVSPLPDGRVAVYTGDDDENEHLYKFIADKPNSLETGTLYVANLEDRKWESLNWAEQPALQERFKDQVEVLIRCREAAKLVGATPLDRPEDIEIDPANGSILVTLTDNIPKGNYYGSILRLMETGDDPASLTFEWDTFLSGGPETGFACPDNLAFDPKGNLWLATDVSGSKINTERYKAFQHNGLFYIPMSGSNAGKIFQVASAPVDAELTGPYFSPDGKYLFLSVQHPGEKSKSMDDLRSHWPDGGSSEPRSSVVVISGEAMDELMA